MPRAIATSVKTWFVHPRLSIHLALLVTLLTAPALGIGFQFDDYFHRLVMQGHEAITVGPLEVFATLRDPGVVREHVERGLLPWWTPPDFRLAFFRYVSAASMWIDYEAWPNVPWLMHLHSLAWCALLVVVATALYRRLIGAHWAAGLAALLYAVDDASAGPAAWLANRNALLATTFGVLSIWAFDRWRRGGTTRDAALSTLCLALALGSGEMAIATGGYLVAYALFLDDGAWRRRLGALAPHLMVFVAWAAVYSAFGFGTHGSDFYQDPLDRPAAFLAALAARAPVLLLGEWTSVPADWATFFPDEVFPVFWIAGLVVVALGLVFLTPLVRASRLARFWTLGMLLSLVPVAGVVPADRLLLFVSLGGMGLTAEFVRGLRESAAWVPGAAVWRVSARVVVVLVLFGHLVVTPLTRPMAAYAMKALGDPMVAAVASVPDDAAIAEQDLVIVNPPDYLFLVTPIGTLKILDGRPYPRRLRALVSGASPVELTRLDAYSLRVRAPDGLYGGVLGRLFRSRRDPMRPSQVFEVPGMRVEIVATDPDGNPLEFIHTFAVPLEDASLRWLRWEETGYVPFTPPAVGASVALPAGFGPMDVARRQWR